LASNHSRGGRFHSSAAWFNTKYSSFIAASSFGKWPRVRTARRSFEFSASMAFVTGMRFLVPISCCGFRDRGVWCDHPGQRHREHESAGRPMYTMSCELVLVAGRLCDSPGCAVSADP
jgi:hypothetical protein